MPTVRLTRCLDELTDTEDLEKMWTLMRPELERRVGKRNYVSLPHLTDGNCYGVGSVFVKVEESGMFCFYKCKFLPLGPVEDLVEYDSTENYWHTKHPSLYSESSELDPCQYFKIAKEDMCSNMEDVGFSILLQDSQNHKQIKLNVDCLHSQSIPLRLYPITLQDLQSNKKIRLNVDCLHSRPIPLGLNPVKSIRFSRSSKPELENTDVIYLVTAVKEAERLELSGTVGARTRTYHVIHNYPLFFKYGKFRMNDQGEIIKKMRCRPSTKHTEWIRVNKTENIDDVPLPDWKLNELII